MKDLENGVRELVMALGESGICTVPLSKTKEPLVDDWQRKTFSPSEILSYNPSFVGIALGINGLYALSVELSDGEELEAFKRKMRSLLYGKVNLEKILFYQTKSTSVYLIYWSGVEVNKKVIAHDLDNEPIVSVLGSGDYFVCDQFPVTSLEIPEYLTEKELNTLMLFSCSLDTSVSQNGIVQEYNQTHTCGELMSYYGWNYTTTEPLGQRWERSDTNTKIGAVVYPNNQIAVERGDSILPHYTALKPSDLKVYYEHKGNEKLFIKYQRDYPKDIFNEKRKTNRFKVERIDTMLERNKNLPPLRMLFGEFWHEQELCILFGPTNTGKSFLAVQIAIALSDGQTNYDHFNIDQKKRCVLYLDLELSDRQISQRLKGLSRECSVLRAAFDPEYLYDKRTQKSALEDIEQLIILNYADTVILDNISVLQPNTERAADATELLNQLNNLKRRHRIPILVIAHTPKLPDGSPIEMSHIAGSSQMGNLIDSAFAIGKTHKSNQRYLKQTKVRAKEFRFDSDNVLLLELVKKDGWMHFVPVDEVPEQSVLKVHLSNDEREDRNRKIFKEYDDGASVKQLIETYSLKKSMIHRIINSMKESTPLD
jgi:archaellum biogenesis ATPase FlaH